MWSPGTFRASNNDLNPMRIIMRKRFAVIGLVAICLFASAPVVGAEKGNGYGLRAGLGIDPDQFVVGIQTLLSKKVANVARLAPGVDVGFGDNLTVIAFNLDVLILDLSPPKSSASLYAGAGPTFAYWKPDNGDSDLEIGISLIAGVRLPMGSRNRYNLEARFGVSDIPDIRILFGTLFGGR